jgi:hypothetical protein
LTRTAYVHDFVISPLVVKGRKTRNQWSYLPTLPQAPYQIIRIRHTHILDDPFPDPAGLPVPDPDKSPMRPVPDQFKNRLEEGQEIDLVLVVPF